MFINCEGKQILPNEILWRKKEAFSDGVSSSGRSLYQILQENIANKINKEQKNLQTMNGKDITFEPNIETEKMYYKDIFNKYFPNCKHILPYFWMPKYTNATDPSARTLTFYSDK